MTKFCGLKTGFSAAGEGAVPNASGAPKTRFSGRGGLPAGVLKRYPGSVAETSGGNRRLAKSGEGDGNGSGTRFSGHTGFHKGR